MPEYFVKKFARQRKGEKGEIDVFQQVLRLSSLCGKDGKNETIGLAAFPNVDSSCFQEGKENIIKHAEIDLVLLHPKKGIFIFNVKNQVHDQLKESASKIVEDIKDKHSVFLRQLCQAPESTPINAVVCSVGCNIELEVQKAIMGPLQDAKIQGGCFFLNADEIRDTDKFVAKCRDDIFGQVKDLDPTQIGQVVFLGFLRAAIK